MSTTPNKKRGRPSKAAIAAAHLGGWDRGAVKQETPGRRAKRGRPSKRTEAARAMAAARTAKLSPGRRSEIAAAGGKAASHATKPSKCEHCNASIPTAREARKHPAQCRTLILARIQRRLEHRSR
jgi:hypothetical protein